MHDKKLAAFFSVSSVSTYCSIEKKRLKNLRGNYLFLQSLVKEEKKAVRLRREARRKTWKKAKARLSAADSFRSRRRISSDENSTKSADNGCVGNRPQVRERSRLMRFEQPEDDAYSYCFYCGVEYLESCPAHGSMYEVQDSQITGTDVGRAWHSLPASLSLRQSGIPGAGLGVWTNQFVKERTRFGPYEGEVITDKERAEASGYCWELRARGQNGEIQYVDAKDQHKSNWLRYVNCCRNVEEQNLIAYQSCGKVFYRTVKDIPAGTELLVWYGETYGRELDAKEERMYSISYFPKKKIHYADENVISRHCEKAVLKSWQVKSSDEKAEVGELRASDGETSRVMLSASARRKRSLTGMSSGTTVKFEKPARNTLSASLSAQSEQDGGIHVSCSSATGIQKQDFPLSEAELNCRVVCERLNIPDCQQTVNCVNFASSYSSLPRKLTRIVRQHKKKTGKLYTTRTRRRTVSAHGFSNILESPDLHEPSKTSCPTSLNCAISEPNGDSSKGDISKVDLKCRVQCERLTLSDPQVSVNCAGLQQFLSSTPLKVPKLGALKVKPDSSNLEKLKSSKILQDKTTPSESDGAVSDLREQDSSINGHVERPDSSGSEKQKGTEALSNLNTLEEFQVVASQSRRCSMSAIEEENVNDKSFMHPNNFESVKMPELTPVHSPGSKYLDISKSQSSISEASPRSCSDVSVNGNLEISPGFLKKVDLFCSKGASKNRLVQKKRTRRRLLGFKDQDHMELEKAGFNSNDSSGDIDNIWGLYCSLNMDQHNYLTTDCSVRQDSFSSGQIYLCFDESSCYDCDEMCHTGSHTAGELSPVDTGYDTEEGLSPSYTKEPYYCVWQTYADLNSDTDRDYNILNN